MIKFNLVKFDKTLLFQIVEQNLLFVGDANREAKSDHNNGVSVLVCDEPEIRIDYETNIVYRIFLRGASSKKDNILCKLSFNSNEYRDSVYNQIIMALRSASNSTFIWQ